MHSDAGGAFFHVNLCTYTDLVRSGSAVASFVEMALDLADQAGLPLRLSLERPGARRPNQGRPLNSRTRHELRTALEMGEFVNVFVFTDRPELGFALTVRGADAYNTIATRIRNAAALETIRQAQAARPSPRFLNLAIATIPTDIAPIVDNTKRTFEQIEGACGFITIDPPQFISGDQTPYEVAHRQYWATTPDLFRTRLRGVYWGNLLSARHVELLGGYDRVKREAPCHLIEQIGDGGYLQLTEHPSRISAQQEQALRDFLEPLLQY